MTFENLESLASSQEEKLSTKDKLKMVAITPLVLFSLPIVAPPVLGGYFGFKLFTNEEDPIGEVSLMGGFAGLVGGVIVSSLYVDHALVPGASYLFEKISSLF